MREIRRGKQEQFARKCRRPDDNYNDNDNDNDNEIDMRSRTLVFAVFAAAMLFSMVREWSAPLGCPRQAIAGTRTRQPH